MTASPYGFLMLVGIGVSIAFWRRVAKRDDRLMLIYIAALTGAFLGAKLIYIAAEGWLHFGAPDMWLQLATGKSILGALMGGFAAVEIAKKYTGYRSVTGDWFATIVPVSVAIGRIGCLLHGCCLGEICEPAQWWTLRDATGVPRWPAVPIEIAFNLLAAATFLILRRKRLLTGQHFHLYMIAYGLFRFAHEFVRDTPRVVPGISGYQIAALVLALMGAVGFLIRQKRAIDEKAEGAVTVRDALAAKP